MSEFIKVVLILIAIFAIVFFIAMAGILLMPSVTLEQYRKLHDKAYEIKKGK